MTKVVGLGELARLVPDGSHLALTGFAITRNAVAAALAVAEAGPRGLTVSQVVGGLETDVLVAAGCVRRLVYSGGSLDRFGPLHSVNRAIGDGALLAEEHSSLAITLRYHAGAHGLPFVPTRSMLGSDLLDRLVAAGVARVGVDPFTGAPVVLLPPLRPDVALVHADAADEDGNAVVRGPRWALRETALAARSVLVTCERLVEPGTLDPDDVAVPAVVVQAVAEAPQGSRPTALFGAYDYDAAALRAYVAAARRDGGDARLALAGTGGGGS